MSEPEPEEVKEDGQFRLMMYYKVPHAKSAEPPMFRASCFRGSIPEEIALGPLFAKTMVDGPYPMIGTQFHDYVRRVLLSAAELLTAERGNLTWVSNDREITEDLLPRYLDGM